MTQRHYLEEQKRDDIARELGVSRLLNSRMLSKERELGIMEIVVHYDRNTLAVQLKSAYASVEAAEGKPAAINSQFSDVVRRLTMTKIVKVIVFAMERPERELCLILPKLPCVKSE